MRSSGGRGADAWMIVIPVAALLVAGTMSAGGLDGVLLSVERVIRHAVAAGLDWVRALI